MATDTRKAGQRRPKGKNGAAKTDRQLQAERARELARLSALEKQAGGLLVQAVERLETLDATARDATAFGDWSELLDSCKRGYKPTLRGGDTHGDRVSASTRLYMGRILRLRSFLQFEGVQVFPSIQIPVRCTACGTEWCATEAGRKVENDHGDVSEVWRCPGYCGKLASYALDNTYAHDSSTPEGWIQ